MHGASSTDNLELPRKLSAKNNKKKGNRQVKDEIHSSIGNDLKILKIKNWKELSMENISQVDSVRSAPSYSHKLN